MFRRPGNVHCHFFGTATLSFVDGIRAEPRDVFEFSDYMNTLHDDVLTETILMRDLVLR